jgi:hypothetical protein
MQPTSSGQKQRRFIVCHIYRILRRMGRDNGPWPVPTVRFGHTLNERPNRDRLANRTTKPGGHALDVDAAHDVTRHVQALVARHCPAQCAVARNDLAR